MPAVDYRIPDGLSWDELAVVLRAGVGSCRAVGINVTIFNPKLDGDGSIARAFIQALAQRTSGRDARRFALQPARVRL